ncbi:hypothetical protein LB507_010447 [Fusarium sp. FIESC RH6]|nr:hypothetical protein LB507_010447 [Fusarium sp. FIESC RH6]
MDLPTGYKQAVENEKRQSMDDLLESDPAVAVAVAVVTGTGTAVVKPGSLTGPERGKDKAVLFPRYHQATHSLISWS